MTTVGLRELSHHTSRYLAQVKAGQVITVTERGRPIATLAPVGGADEDAPPRRRIGGYRSGNAMSAEQIDAELGAGFGRDDRR